MASNEEIIEEFEKSKDYIPDEGYSNGNVPYATRPIGRH